MTLSQLDGNFPPNITVDDAETNRKRKTERMRIGIMIQLISCLVTCILYIRHLKASHCGIQCDMNFRFNIYFCYETHTGKYVRSFIECRLVSPYIFSQFLLRFDEKQNDIQYFPCVHQNFSNQYDLCDRSMFFLLFITKITD